MSIRDPNYIKNLQHKSSNIFIACSKRNFYQRAAISAWVLKAGYTPISPFMNVDYNLGGLVAKDLIRIANNSLIKACDELWVFDEVSDGVLLEIYLARKSGKPIKYLQHVAKNDQLFMFIPEEQVRLEDVSPWLWEWMLSGRDLTRWHPRLRFHKTYPVVYPAYSKRNFYWQMHISKFCLEQKMIPLNPFMLFRYFLGDSVPREEVYRANADIVSLSDAVWTFGEVSDGVLDEVVLKRKLGGDVRHYRIENDKLANFRKVSARSVMFEDPALESRRAELLSR
ncbi:MAG TPA: hypothetical protein VLF91_04460 [Candidatus Saccharimonadales bacterium]|nr:hypothetical protein [Candidatus Saccharimonadales bacterium]